MMITTATTMIMMMVICKVKSTLNLAKETNPEKMSSPTKISFTPEAPIYTRNCVVPAAISITLALLPCNPKIAAV